MLNALALPEPEQQHDHVLSEFSTLPVGKSLRVVVDHEPRQLRFRFNELYAGCYVWTQRYLGEGFWVAIIRCIARRAEPPDEREAVLACSPLFADVSTSDLAVLAERASQKIVAAGTVIVEQGSSWPYFGVVATGSVAAIVNTSTGRDYALFEALPSDLFGEVQALDGGASIARFVAASQGSTILMIPRASVVNLATRDGLFGIRLATLLAQRARLFGELLYARAAKPTIGRLAAAILPYATRSDSMAPALFPLSSMSQVELARIVGTVKDVVGRDLAELREAGALSLSGGRITNINESRLRPFL
jgi:CRP/FNR family transcriptional regulator, cyclic AMP receptor protein